MSDQYPHTVIVQFQNSGGLGSVDELDWRNEQGDRIELLLKQAGLGWCDGGQCGAGTMEIFFFVSSVQQAAELIIADLTDRELIGWAKIVSFNETGSCHDVHWPVGGKFNMWQWVE